MAAATTAGAGTLGEVAPVLAEVVGVALLGELVPVLVELVAATPVGAGTLGEVLGELVSMLGELISMLGEVVAAAALDGADTCPAAIAAAHTSAAVAAGATAPGLDLGLGTMPEQAQIPGQDQMASRMEKTWGRMGVGLVLQG